MSKKSRKIVAIFVILFFIIALIGISIFYVISSLNPTDDFINGNVCNSTSPCETTRFIVEEGAYPKDTLYKLQDENIIRNADMAYYYNRILGGYDFYAGTYEIPHSQNGINMSLDDILYYISVPTNAKQDISTILLDEGDFAKSFARKIAENIEITDLTYENKDEETIRILQYWNDPDVVRSYMNDYPFLTEDIINGDAKILMEGYLFPDTYQFLEYSSIDQVTRKILDRTLDIYESHIDEFNNSKLTTHEIFTLASIVQWESGDPEDSKLVAGSLLNRIDNPAHEGTGGRLQSTVTACYAFDLTKSECDEFGDSTRYTETDHVYNTYTIEGFPPGPVCCPNEIAITAALNPNQAANYYFFVANMCDGGTAFSTTYAQHQANINRYYLPCAE